MEFYKILENLMLQKGLSIADVARMCDLPDSTVRSIIDRKQKKVALSVAFNLSDGLNVPLERLAGIQTESDKKAGLTISDEAMDIARKYNDLDEHGQAAVSAVIDCEVKRCLEQRQRPAKVVELFPTRKYLQPASAGYGDFNDDASYEIVDLVKRPPMGTSFIITAHGDSMEPTYHDGEALFVRAQETVLPGEIGLFTKGPDLLIKESGPDGLISHNKTYGLITGTEDEPIRAQGKILGVCTKDYLR